LIISVNVSLRVITVIHNPYNFDLLKYCKILTLIALGPEENEEKINRSLLGYKNF